MWRSPDLHHQIVVRDPLFRNIPVKGVDEAIDFARQHNDAESDVYFACAEYLTPNNRKAENTAGAWAFWMDLDCGPDKAEAGKGYATVELADAAIKEFCKETGLPAPTHIVGSGGGLHVYWVLTEFLPTAQWQGATTKLKGLGKTWGLLADSTRTADIASILRTPGTQNYKYDPPRPVVLQATTKIFIVKAEMLDAINSAHDRLCGPQPALQSPSPRQESQPIGPHDLERLRSALPWLNPDCDEATWKLGNR